MKEQFQLQKEELDQLFNKLEKDIYNGKLSIFTLKIMMVIAVFGIIYCIFK